MTSSSDILIAVEVDAPAPVVWDAITDWARQGEWMLGTTVRAIGPTGGHARGERLEAFTGAQRLGGRVRLGFLDTMEITGWDPPRRCEVRHTGRVVRGTGIFTVEELPRDRSRFVWEERLDLPLGRLGLLGFGLVRPAVEAGVRRSLLGMARQTAAAYHPGPAAR